MNTISVLVWVDLSSFLNHPTPHVVVLQLLDNVRVAYNWIPPRILLYHAEKISMATTTRMATLYACPPKLRCPFIENCLPMFGGPAGGGEVVVSADATLPGWLLLNQPSAEAVVQKYVRQKFG